MNIEKMCKYVVLGKILEWIIFKSISLQQKEGLQLLRQKAEILEL